MFIFIEILTKKMSEILVLCYNPRLHTNVCTTDTITNFGWTVLPHLPFSPGLTCFSERQEEKKVWKDTVMPVMRQCRMSHSSGCNWAMFITWEYRFLFEGGRRLLTKIETIKKSNCLQECCSEVLWSFHMSN
jgi:hypothetical protein